MIRWQIPFQSFDGTQYTVNIYDNSFTGTPTTLKGAGEPFVTDEDNDNDPFTPIRTQSGYIRIVAQYESDLAVLREMAGNNRYVTLTKGSTLVWHGYIQPQTFSQSWAPMPYEIAIPVESCLSHLSSIDYEPQQSDLTIQALLLSIFSNVPNFEKVIIQNSTVADVLASSIHDSIFISEDEDKVHRLGVNADLVPPESKTDCMEVISHICSFFGLVCREFGGTFIFSYPGSTANYTVLTAGGQTSQLSASSRELPQVMSASNTEEYLDGKKFIDITESLKIGDSVIDSNVSHYDETGSTIHTGNYSDFGKLDWCKDYLDQTYARSFQHSNPSSPAQLAHACLFGLSPSSNYLGGNILRVIQAKPYAYSSITNDEAKNGFGILNNMGIADGAHHPAVSIETARTMYGRDYAQGLKLTGNLELGSLTTGWEGTPQLYISIKWGNKYLNLPSTSTIAPTWSTTVKYIKVTGNKMNGGFITRTDSAGTVYSIAIDDYLYIPTNSTLEGKITIVMYASQSNSYILVSDLELTAMGDNKVLFDPCVDLSQNCFRSNIGLYSETYNRDLLLCSQMRSEQSSETFVRDANNNIYAGQPETAMLNKMVAWFNRSTKQITVDVDDEDYTPLDSITVGTETYTIISASRNYINNTVKLQMQLNP